MRDAVEAQFFLDYRTGRVWQKEQVCHTCSPTFIHTKTRTHAYRHHLFWLKRVATLLCLLVLWGQHDCVLFSELLFRLPLLQHLSVVHDAPTALGADFPAIAAPCLAFLLRVTHLASELKPNKCKSYAHCKASHLVCMTS